MNELTFSPKSPFQVFDEIDKCLLNSEDQNETVKKIRELVKEIQILQKEDNENFQKLMGLDLLSLSIKMNMISPRLAWKFSKSVTCYPQKEVFLRALSNNFVHQGLLGKAVKVINSNDDKKQKAISIDFLLDFLFETAKKDQQISGRIITDMQLAVDKCTYESQAKLYLKIYELCKISLPPEKKSDNLKKQAVEKLVDAHVENSISKVEKVKEPCKEPEKKKIFRHIENPTLSEINEMIIAYDEDKDSSSITKSAMRIAIQDNLSRFLENNTNSNESILNFIHSINNIKIKNEVINVLLRAFKNSDDINKRLLYIDLLKEKNTHLDKRYILECVDMLKKASVSVDKRNKFLIYLFEKVNWLNEDYDCVNEILNSVSYKLTKEVFRERFVKRYFFLDVCTAIQNTHPELVAEKKKLISKMEQAESENILKEFVQELLVMADKFEMAYNIDGYIKTDSGRKVILKILSALAKQAEIDRANSEKNAIYAQVRAYGIGQHSLEDLEESLISFIIDEPLLKEIFSIDDKIKKINLLNVIRSILRNLEEPSYFTEEDLIGLLDQHQLLDDIFYE